MLSWRNFHQHKTMFSKKTLATKKSLDNYLTKASHNLQNMLPNNCPITAKYSWSHMLLLRRSQALFIRNTCFWQMSILFRASIHSNSFCLYAISIWFRDRTETWFCCMYDAILTFVTSWYSLRLAKMENRNLKREYSQPMYTITKIN